MTITEEIKFDKLQEENETLKKELENCINKEKLINEIKMTNFDKLTLDCLLIDMEKIMKCSYCKRCDYPFSNSWYTQKYDDNICTDCFAEQGEWEDE